MLSLSRVKPPQSHPMTTGIGCRPLGPDRCMDSKVLLLKHFFIWKKQKDNILKLDIDQPQNAKWVSSSAGQLTWKKVISN